MRVPKLDHKAASQETEIYSTRHAEVAPQTTHRDLTAASLSTRSIEREIYRTTEHTQGAPKSVDHD